MTTPNERGIAIARVLSLRVAMPLSDQAWLAESIANAIMEALVSERHRCAELARSAIHAYTPCMHEGFPTIPIPPPLGPPGVTQMD